MNLPLSVNFVLYIITQNLNLSRGLAADCPIL
nr:MAG TPA: hypothetical protein [Caudoviricetes sp.]